MAGSRGRGRGLTTALSLHDAGLSDAVAGCGVATAELAYHNVYGTQICYLQRPAVDCSGC
ncbi:hypothetical protein ABH926_005121 [Catenulispora sp. GP43]|uniref:hypothetical protein n=1 Tax=Catenulispora sp. GP43 TaxID=3156263 RepID=UPI003512FE9F